MTADRGEAELQSGQWWVQPEFPNMRRYVAFLTLDDDGEALFGMLQDPRERGQMLCSAEINGVEYWVSAWTNTDKNGNRYQKLKFTPKEETNQRGRQQARQVVDSGGADFDDSEVPF